MKGKLKLITMIGIIIVIGVVTNQDKFTFSQETLKVMKYFDTKHKIKDITTIEPTQMCRVQEIKGMFEEKQKISKEDIDKPTIEECDNAITDYRIKRIPNDLVNGILKNIYLIGFIFFGMWFIG